MATELSLSLGSHKSLFYPHASHYASPQSYIVSSVTAGRAGVVAAEASCTQEAGDEADLVCATLLMQSVNVCLQPDSWKADFIKNERKKLLNYKAQLVTSLQPKIYCPFAGYFVEAHPSDR